MKYKYKSIAFLLSALGMVSCSTTDTESDIKSNGSDVLRVTTEMTTRSVITSSSFAKGDNIGVFALNTNGNAYSSTSTNMLATYDGSNWNFTGNVTHLTENANADVYAYYPYTSSATNILKIPVDISYNSTTGQADYLYGAGGSHNLSNPQADILFKFALARITLQLSVAEGNVNDKLVINSVKLANSNSYGIATSGTMNTKTGEITATGNADAFINVPMSATITKTEATTTDLLVIPTSVANGNVTLTLSINGYVASVSLPDVSWEMGRQYTYPVKVSLKENKIAELTISNPTIVPRTNTTQSSQDLVVDLTDQPSIDEAIDLGLPSGVKWASYNVGATKPEEYGGYYAWGETKTKSDYSEESYLYYANSSYISIGSNISGTQYDVAHVKWGGNWRMPTYTEQTELSENCTSAWTTINGVTGMKFTSKKNGNSIFLPAAGGQRGSSVSDTGTLGHYWSSTLRNNARGYYLGFYSTDLDWDTYRYDGFSVRAVYQQLTPTSIR